MKKREYSRQMKSLRQAAKRRGLRVREDKRLIPTPYAAMHPLAAKVLHQPCGPKEVGFTNRRGPTELMDIRHELLEYDKMKLGWSYKKAHKYANRYQRTLGAEFWR